MNRFDDRGRRPGRSRPPGSQRHSDRRDSSRDRGSMRPHRPAASMARRDRLADARAVTFEALGALENHRGFVSDVLERLYSERGVQPSDRGLATEMSCGIVRRQATLDMLLGAACDRPRELVQDGLWRLMRIGAYQLAWLPSIPPHAAIHETVELAHRMGQSGWAGFLNAVLRRLQRDVLPMDHAGWSSQRTLSDLAQNPEANWLPLRRSQAFGHAPEAGPGDEIVMEGLQLRLAILPDPSRFRAAFWAAAFSYPEWMIDDWIQHLGEYTALDRASWFNTTGSMCLRVNLARTTRGSVLESLASAHIDAQAGGYSESIQLDRSIAVSELPGFWEGMLSVQDESAMAAASLLAPQAGWRVLDLCAAPGGKTAHMAEYMRNQGEIVACDSTAERLPLIQENSRRLHLDIVRTHHVQSDGADTPDGPFDAALVDVPCSNTGVLGKRPEVRWRFVPGELRELVPIQIRLLSTALDRVRPGGRVVYSTCSCDARENEAVVQAVIGGRADWQQIEERKHIPGHPVDGGYCALLIRQ